MSRESLEPEELVSLLSHRPAYLLYSMITIRDPPTSMSALQPQEHPSSLGFLDRLPAELLLEVVGYIDLQTLTRFSCASRRAKDMLQSLPAYGELMSHAPHALAALGRTGLIRLHSVNKLLAALQTERCATCPEYGAYLFLPTCQRSCWQCLRFKSTRRVITPTAAGKAFALPPSKVQQLPFMFSIPGDYGIRQKRSQRPNRLVSVSAALELAISIRGSPGSLAETLSRRKCPSATEQTVRYLQSAISASAICDTLMMPDQGNGLDDPYFGMASIPFPSTSRVNIVEEGLWCKGCDWMYDRHHQLPAYVVNCKVPSNCDSGRVLLGLSRRAYSSSGLLEHVRHCYGANRLIDELADGH